MHFCRWVDDEILQGTENEIIKRSISILNGQLHKMDGIYRRVKMAESNEIKLLKSALKMIRGDASV